MQAPGERFPFATRPPGEAPRTPARRAARAAREETDGSRSRPAPRRGPRYTRNAAGSSDMEISEPSKRIRFGLSSTTVKIDTGRRQIFSTCRNVSRA